MRPSCSKKFDKSIRFTNTLNFRTVFSCSGHAHQRLVACLSLNLLESGLAVMITVAHQEGVAGTMACGGSVMREMIQDVAIEKEADVTNEGNGLSAVAF
ncbi:hypothetical protein SADUNF_Sadunf15G0071800 [Salix dunnii]|uniref:Uncharacterized protein n=1 Tax=Salix dunnii TaxID=1413687 RepID=A0A835JEG2_9ROSI|nr:hypothetical protein SADUNF_Sadunf15G0071800 [Salix dunnii]